MSQAGSERSKGLLAPLSIGFLLKQPASYSYAKSPKKNQNGWQFLCVPMSFFSFPNPARKTLETPLAIWRDGTLVVFCSLGANPTTELKSLVRSEVMWNGAMSLSLRITP
jgi:hypothetical protein